jgi:EAL domain-containing protein (putative c-di-GMP-specific phosphodiesterase class I)
MSNLRLRLFRLWPRHLEMLVPLVFVATLLLVSVVYLLLDFQRMRMELSDRYQAHAAGLLRWTEANLDTIATELRKSAEGARDLCSGEAMASLRQGINTLVPLTALELRSNDGEACTWRPAKAPPPTCAGAADAGTVRVPMSLGEGWHAILDVRGACLFSALAPSDMAFTVGRSMRPRTKAEPAARQAGTAKQVWSSFLGTLEVEAVSGRWPVAVRVEIGGASVVHNWIKELPLQLSLIGGLSLALWFGPMSVVRSRLSVEGQVRRALRRNDFFLAYLPTVELSSRNWVGAEALLRWRHARYGVLMPGAFIPWIEASPLIHDTTRWVMIRAARDLPEMSRCIPDFSLSVNVPPNQIADPRLIDLADEAFGTQPYAMCQVVIEMTERQMLDHNAPALRHVLAELRRRGAQIAIDDFGSGFSNLTALGMIDADHVKIDRSFLQEEAWTQPNMLEAMMPLLRDIGVLVIAEGIETERQLDRVRRCGIRFAQGFLFARPMELDALLARLANEAERLRA